MRKRLVKLISIDACGTWWELVETPGFSLENAVANTITYGHELWIFDLTEGPA